MSIEEIVRAYLDDVLGDTPVRLELPNNPPSKIVIIEKTTGGEENHIKTATLAIQSYGERMLDVITLNEKIKDVMSNIITLNEICKCKLNSDYNYTDTTTKKYRYQAVFDIYYY